MCIALPRKVVAVLDPERALVAVAGGESADEPVSAALLVAPGRPLAALVGAYVLVHAGFAISVLEEAEAASRLNVFAALDGGGEALDLAEFHAEMQRADPGKAGT